MGHRGDQEPHPGQQVVKIVNEELVTTLGTEPARLSSEPLSHRP